MNESFDYRGLMKNLWNRFFPLSRIKGKHLTTEEYKKYFSNDEPTGEEYVAALYYLSTDRDLLRDTMVGAFFLAGCFMVFIIVLSSLIWMVR